MQGNPGFVYPEGFLRRLRGQDCCPERIGAPSENRTRKPFNMSNGEVATGLLRLCMAHRRRRIYGRLPGRHLGREATGQLPLVRLPDTRVVDLCGAHVFIRTQPFVPLTPTELLFPRDTCQASPVEQSADESIFSWTPGSHGGNSPMPSTTLPDRRAGLSSRARNPLEPAPRRS